MNVVGKVSNFVTSVATPFHPFGGAVDIIVVKQQDGSFRSTPWYVRFGKFQGVLKGAEKIVKIEVNGVEANFHMHLDASGEASFIEEIVTDKLKNSDSKKHEEDGKKDMKKPLDRKESVRFYDLEVQDEFEVRDERVSNLGNLERKESVKFYDFQDELDEAAEFSEYNNLDNVNSELSLESEVILVSVDGHILTAPITSAEKNGEDVAIDTPRFHLGNTEVQDGDVNASSSGSGLEDVYDMIKNQNGESVGIKKDDVFKSCLGLSDLGKEESIRRSPEAIKEEEEVCAKISGNGDVIECSSSDFPGPTVIDSNVNNEKTEEQIKEVQSGLPVSEEVQGDLPVTVSEEVQGALPVPVSEEARGDLPGTEEAQGNLPVTKEVGSGLPVTEEVRSGLPVTEEAQGNLCVTEEVQSGLPVSEEVQSGLPVTEEANNNVVPIEGEEIAKVNEVGPTEEKENEKVGPTEGEENEKVGPIEVNDEVAKSKEDESSEIPATTPSGSSRWSLWPNPFRRVKTIEHSNSMVSVDDVFVDFEPAEPPVTETGVPGADSPHKQFVRTNVPTSEHIASLDLKEGQNMVTFIFSTRYLGVQKVDAHIYLWKYNTRIVISDVDGTITKSDVLGQFMPLVGKDWTHTGIAHFFSAIKENGYQLLFLSARAIVQAYLTRSFLFNLKQDGKTLPAGPVVISPDGLFPSLYREVIRRAPHEFKIGCLEDIRALFPPDYNPFYAGFGNRDTDELSYRKIGIPKGKIFIINPKGEVAINRRIDVKSYTSLHTLVHDMFPPTSMVEQEDFNSWNFWKTPLPDIDDL